jgi:propionyl-CoA synthetase
LPMGLMVLKNTEGAAAEQVVAEVIAMVRRDIGAVAAFKQALVVARLPKTRSGKILRKTLRAIVDGDEYTLPSTIEDPAVLDEIKTLLQR